MDPEGNKRPFKRIRHNSNSENVTDADLTPSKVTKTEKIRQNKACAVVVRSKEMRAFFSLAEDPVIFKFLSMDSCKRLADKYLLAMVFAYFKRAGFAIREFNRRNFFVALYLASDMEEDEEEMKYEIFPWALGYNWRNSYKDFWKRRDKLWKRIEYRASVSKKCCDEIMAVQPDHWLWSRQRPEHHGGAMRTLEEEDDEDGYPRGPDASPRVCPQCDLLCGSVSPGQASWYLSSSASSSPESEDKPLCKSTRVVSRSWLHMEGLRKTLAAAEKEILVPKPAPKEE